MSVARAILAGAGLLCWALGARGQETLDEEARPSAGPPGAGEQQLRERAGAGGAGAEVNGYLADRVGYGWVSPAGPISTQDMPSLSEMAEANIQLRVDLGNKTRFVYADLSLVYQGSWLFYVDDGAGRRQAIANHDIPSLHPFVAPSELYVSISPRPSLNVLVGKKRITWGSGFAFNPTDVINPPKDPTDPNFQRAGNWVARIESPFEKFTITGLFAPQALYTQSGIPYAFLRYPDYPPAQGAEARDGASHYLLAARLYMLLFDADVNLIYYFSNRYQDGFENKSRIGLSFSRYFITDYELHAEALLSRGSPRSFPDHECAVGTVSCDLTAAFAPTKLAAKGPYPRVIVGSRRQFSDESLLSLEYYYQGDGYADREFADALALLAAAKAAGATASSGQAPSGNALPQRFAFDPLRRHYLIASYSKPRMRDDWTVGAVLVAGLRDLSGLLSPSVAWSARQWLTLSVYGYLPIRGLGVGEARVGSRSWSEYSVWPFDFRVLFEARAFY
jgi:hypothetical protein